MATAPAQFFYSADTLQSLLNWCKRQITPVRDSGQTSGFFHRNALERIDREYYRDNIYTEDKIKATLANRAGDKKKLQDVVLPVVEMQTETMKAYLTSVFLTGNPLFGITADAANIAAAKMWQGIIAEQAIRGNWVAELLDVIHDSLKYFGVAEAEWCKEITYTMEPNVSDQGKFNNVKELVWEGNVLRRIDPYNAFWDVRVPLTEVHKRGEYCGYVELDTRTSLKTYIDSKGLKMNVDKVFDPNQMSSPESELYFTPDFIWDSIDNIRTTPRGQRGTVTDFTDFEYGTTPSGGRKSYKYLYCRVTRYLRIVPRDFGISVPKPNSVQIWKLVTVNDKFIIELERQTNIHNLFPLIFCQPTMDGLKWISRSFAQKQIPMQDIASALMNGVMDATRRSISDRIVYDPSKIDKNNISTSSPTARIPIKPSAYGQDITKMMYKIPYDISQIPSLAATAREWVEFSNMLSGQNKAQQGQFVKGNKTQKEYEDVQNKSSGRQQMTALKMEAQLFSPIKTIIRANILQYQMGTDVYNYDSQENISVDPKILRNSLAKFQVVDGLTPEDKIVNADALVMGLQTIGSSPYLQSKFDLGPMFVYLMATQNIDMKPYLVQPQVAAQQLQQISNAQATAKGVAPEQQVPPQQAGQQAVPPGTPMTPAAQ